MKIQLLKYWDRIQSSFWFLPSLMMIGSIVLALLSVTLDSVLAERQWFEGTWFFVSSAQGASAVLQTIAGSMITIAGVVFSMTLVALSLASSQFGSRLLRNFMTDKTNQFVLGTFVAAFLYCLLVLRSLRYGEGGAFVPHFSVTLGVVLALMSLAVLIFFIHRVSVSIQAEHLVTRVANELNMQVDELFPEPIGEACEGETKCDELPEDFEDDARAVCADGDGYLQLIDGQVLMQLANDADVVVRIDRRPGHYLTKGQSLASVFPGDRVDDELCQRVNNAFVLGIQRTPVQDIEFAILQLVEVAVRALSPGVNDPFTAIACVDRLGAAMCRVAGREMPNPSRKNEAGQLRIVASPPTFAGFMDAAFNQLRQHGSSDAAVAIRLLETLAVIASVAERAEDRATIGRHADMIARAAKKQLPEEYDRQSVETRYKAVAESLGDV